jgi:hypothetical protein
MGLFIRSPYGIGTGSLGSSPRTTSASVTAAAGDTIVVICHGFCSLSGGSFSVSDGTNSYTSPISSACNSGKSLVALYYAANVSAGTFTVSVSLTVPSGNNELCDIEVYVLGGANTSPFVADSSGSGSFTQASTGSLTVGTGDAIIASVVGNGSSPSTYSSGSGLSTLNTGIGINSNAQYADEAEFNLSSGTTTPTFATNSGITTWAMIAVAFAPVSSTGTDQFAQRWVSI